MFNKRFAADSDQGVQTSRKIIAILKLHIRIVSYWYDINEPIQSILEWKRVKNVLACNFGAQKFKTLKSRFFKSFSAIFLHYPRKSTEKVDSTPL